MNPTFRATLSTALLLALGVACGNDQRLVVVSDVPASGSGGSESLAPGDEDSTPVGVALPATIEAEAFVRAQESDPAQQGDESCARADFPGVDIGAADDVSGGCSIGYAEGGEWLEFDVHTPETRSFDVTVSVGTDLDGRSLSLMVDGVYRGSFAVPVIGWTSFEEVTLSGVNLTEGNHVLRFSFDTGGVNFDYLRVDDAGACVPACTDRGCGDDFCGGTCGTCEGEQSCTSGGQCVGPFPEPVLEHGQLAVEEGQIVDESGEPVMLRGVSTQWLNWEQRYSTDAAGMQYLRDAWGMQIFRIANGVEKNNGYADENVRAERMATVKSIIDTAIDLNVYVLVDWHTHEAEYRDLAKEFFTEIAQEYGDQPHVLYEPYNEPIGPNEDIADYWAKELKPYHEDVVQTIRAEDPDNVIILGTPRWAQRVDVASEDPVAGDHLAYALHFYSCTHTDWLRGHAQTALDNGAALFVTEWAATHADGGTADNPGACIGAAQTWHDWLEERSIGSAAWKLNADGDASSIFLQGAPTSGDWTTEQLSEHGALVRDLLQTSR